MAKIPPPNIPPQPTNNTETTTRKGGSEQTGRPQPQGSDNFGGKVQGPDPKRDDFLDKLKPTSDAKLIIANEQTLNFEIINKAFGVDVKSMRMLDLYNLISDLSEGKVDFPDDYKVMIELMDVLEKSNLSKAQKFGLIKRGVQKTIKDPVMDSKQRGSQEVFFKSLIDLAGKIDMPEAVGFLVDLTSQMNNSKILKKDVMAPVASLKKAFENAKKNDNKKVLDAFKLNADKVKMLITTFSKERVVAKKDNDFYVEGRLNNVISDLSEMDVELSPPFEDLTKGEFRENIINKLDKYSKEIPFFKVAKEIYEKTPYSIHFYPDPNNPSELADHVMKNATAFVNHHHKVAFFNLPEIHIGAINHGKKPEAQLLGALANEAVHLRSKVNYESVAPEKVDEAIKDIKESEKPTAIETMYQRHMEDELVSQIADDIVNYLIENSKSELTSEDIFDENGVLFEAFEKRRDQAGKMAIERIFQKPFFLSQARNKNYFNNLQEEDKTLYLMFKEQVESKEFKERIESHLQDLKLIK